MPHDIFDDNYRVVDQDTDRQTERQQRHVVQGEVHRLHQEKRRDDRSRDRYACYHCGPPVADEQERDQNRQQAAQDQRGHDIIDIVADIDRVVADDRHFDICRQHICFQLFHPRFDPLGNLHGVGAGLFLHPDQHAGSSHRLGKYPLFGPTVFDLGHVGQSDHPAALVGNHDLADFFHRLVFAKGADRHLIAVGFDPATRCVVVVGIHQIEYRLESYVVSFQFGWFDINVDFTVACAVDVDFGHALQSLQFVFHHVFGDLADLAAFAGRRGQTEVKDRLGGDIVALHHRLVDLIRQTPPHTGDFLPHVVGRQFGVGTQFKLDRGLGDPFARNRG